MHRIKKGAEQILISSLFLCHQALPCMFIKLACVAKEMLLFPLTCIHVVHQCKRFFLQSCMLRWRENARKPGRGSQDYERLKALMTSTVIHISWLVATRLRNLPCVHTETSSEKVKQAGHIIMARITGVFPSDSVSPCAWGSPVQESGGGGTCRCFMFEPWLLVSNESTIIDTQRFYPWISTPG